MEHPPLRAADRGTGRGERRALAAILTTAACLFVWGIGWGLPNMPNAWAPDEFAPVRIHEAIARGFSHGWYELYPPMHVYVLALALAPIEVLSAAGLVDFARPRVYLIAFYTIRLVSVAMGLGIVLVVFAIARELYDARTALLSAATTALIAPLVYYAKIANVDVPYTFWLLLSLYFVLRIVRDGSLRNYLAVATFAAFAIGTKDQAGAFYPFIPAVLWAAEYRRGRAAGRPRPAIAALVHPPLLAAGMYGIVLLAILHNVMFNWTGTVERFEAITGPMTTQMQEFPNTPRGHLSMIALGVRHVQFTLGWPLFLVSVAGAGLALARLRRDPRPLVLLAPVVSYWLFLIVPIMYHFDRYLLPVAVILAVFAGPVFAWLTDQRHRLAFLGVLSTTLILAYSAIHAASVNALLDADGRYDVENWMRENVPPGSRIMAVGYSMYLPRFDGYDVVTSVRPTLEELDARDPDYVVVTSAFDQRRFRDDPASTRFFRRLSAGTTRYAETLRVRRQPRWNLLGDLRTVRSNLDKVNPSITVYIRVRPAA